MTMARGVLTGKVAIVTGASAGIGRAIAELFAAEGARLVITARGEARLQAVADSIAATGAEVVALAGDVGDENHARALVAEAERRFGGLDIAVNNAAAMGPMGATPDVATGDWNATIATNLTGGFLAAKYQVPAMLTRGGGSLLFVASFVGHTVAMPGVAAYAASKAGLINLTKTLATALAPNVRVNAVAPGLVDTPWTADWDAERKSATAARTLLGRMAQPEEVAEAILFLAAGASYMTGQTIVLDGGAT